MDCRHAAGRATSGATYSTGVASSAAPGRVIEAAVIKTRRRRPRRLRWHAGARPAGAMSLRASSSSSLSTIRRASSRCGVFRSNCSSCTAQAATQIQGEPTPAGSKPCSRRRTASISPRLAWRLGWQDRPIRPPVLRLRWPAGIERADQHRGDQMLTGIERGHVELPQQVLLQGLRRGVLRLEIVVPA